MPTIRQTDSSARGRLKRGGGAADARAPFREAIGGLQGDDVIEVVPEGGETMRGLKVNVSRAAREINADVSYGETLDGTLLVWRKSETGRRRRRRRDDSD